MGTRGALGFRINGQDKVTYNHFDSYPEALGKTVLQFVRAHTPAEIRPIADAIKMIDESGTPTPEQIEKYRRYYDGAVSNKAPEDWYCLLRHAQGELEPYMNGLDVMLEGGSFLADSLFCEYAYIVNLDDETLEFYRGFNNNPKAPGRYAALEDAEDNARRDADSKYYGVRLLAAIPLADLQGSRSNVLERIHRLDVKRMEKNEPEKVYERAVWLKKPKQPAPDATATRFSNLDITRS